MSCSLAGMTPTLPHYCLSAMYYKPRRHHGRGYKWRVHWPDSACKHFVWLTLYLSKTWIRCQLLNIQMIPAFLENSEDLAKPSPHTFPGDDMQRNNCPLQTALALCPRSSSRPCLPWPNPPAALRTGSHSTSPEKGLPQRQEALKKMLVKFGGALCFLTPKRRN